MCLYSLINAILSDDERRITQEQQRVAVGPGNAHFIAVRQVSSNTSTLRRGRCGYRRVRGHRPRFYATAAAVYRQFHD